MLFYQISQYNLCMHIIIKLNKNMSVLLVEMIDTIVYLAHVNIWGSQGYSLHTNRWGALCQFIKWFGMVID